MLKDILGRLGASKAAPLPVRQPPAAPKAAPRPGGAPRPGAPKAVPAAPPPRPPAPVREAEDDGDMDEEKGEVFGGSGQSAEPRRFGDRPLRPAALADRAPAMPAAAPRREPAPDAGRGAIVAGARRTPATDEQIDIFLAWQGDVLTAPGGSLNTTDRQRMVTAFLADGSLLVNKGNPLSPESMEVREALKRSGRQIRTEYLVDLDIIRKVHEAAEKRASGPRAGRRGGEALQQMQRELLDIVAEAAARRASDIHIKVERFEAIIRMRADGVMETVRQVPSGWAADLLAAAFNMADASDASYRNLEYQGARISEIRTPLPEGVQSIRLQFNPLPNGGRYLIARLLYATSAADTGGDVDTLGYTKVHVQQLIRMRRKPYGINIISGPTGSGKSTTLLRVLTATMRETRDQKNVITIEDPPEYVIVGAAQLPVLNAQTDEERKEKFRGAIAASLRSDPDIIMIGEIRDTASAGLAFQAAQTGHQVYASLHANTAVDILDRLRDMNVELYKLGDPTLMTGLIGQRLIRRLCPRCKISFAEGLKKNLLEPELVREVERVAGDRLRMVCVANPEPPKECGCRGGFAGREVIAETIAPDLEFMKAIRKGDKEAAVEHWLAKLDGISMLEHAAQKMVRGLCDPRDVVDRAGELEGLADARFPIIFDRLFEAPKGD